MARQRTSRASGKENKSQSQNNKKAQSSGGKKFFKRELKFFGHEHNKKNGYTYEKIEEAIIMKIQSTFEGNTVPYIISSLRNKAKHVFSEPELRVSELSEPVAKAREQLKYDKRYDKQYDYWMENEAAFSSLWSKAYALIWETYCSSELKVTIKEMSRFQTHIRDDPLELLRTVEHLMHVPMKAVYPTLTLIETLTSMVSVKQGDKEGLTTYLERFKSKN